ncbi:MAG TPA: dihydrofolate reductase [Roseiarcus sp.]|nr:dihydrofolate reductase [Roseiarcus sp.]
MRKRFRINGYAIASADGMIADGTGLMPDILKLEADQRFFEEALERADVVVHGRRSHEGQANSTRRRRLTLTRRIAGLAPDPNNPNGRLWNPAGASLEQACAEVGCDGGTIAVLGGPAVYSMFLPLGYDNFYLTRAINVRLPGGMPIFIEGRLGCPPEQLLSRFGLKPGQTQRLDHEVTLVELRRPDARGIAARASSKLTPRRLPARRC